MPNDKINEYIDNVRKAGYSDSQIRETLKKAGWDDKDINEALGIIESKFVPPSPPNAAKVNTSDNHSANANASTNNKTNTLAIVAFVFAFLLPFIGLILGIIAMVEIKKTGEKGRGYAVAAIIIPLILFTLLLLIWGYAFVSYFGVLNPARMMPVRCQFTLGMDCIDTAAITSSEITVALRNNIGFPINVQKVESTLCSGAQIALTQGGEFVNLNNNQVSNNAVFLLKLTGCNNGAKGEQVKDTILVTYENSESGLKSIATGDVRGRVG